MPIISPTYCLLCTHAVGGVVNRIDVYTVPWLG